MAKRQSAWGRALADTERARGHFLFFWGWEVIGATTSAILFPLRFLPDEPNRIQSLAYPGAGVVLGAAIAYALIVLWNLAWAPIRQRNEAWVALDGLTEIGADQALLRIHDPSAYLVTRSPTHVLKIYNDGPQQARSVKVRMVDFAPRRPGESDFAATQCRTNDGVSGNETDINKGDFAEFELFKFGVSAQATGKLYHLQLFSWTLGPLLTIRPSEPYFMDLLVTGQNAVKPEPIRLRIEVDLRKGQEDALVVANSEPLQ